MSDPGDRPAPVQAEDEPQRPVPGARELFVTFLGIALVSFGGGLGLWTQREVVERKRWLDQEEFLAGLGLARLLPGANQINLATHIGTRFGGLRGALAAVAGLTLVPLAILVALGIAYFEVHSLPAIQTALRGAVAVAAGMALAMGVKLAQPYVRRPDAILFGVATFVAVHVLRFPLVAVVAVLAPVAMVWFWPRGEEGKPAR